jgi:hypothetical protein
MIPFYNEALAQQHMAELQQEADDARRTRLARAARRRRATAGARTTLRLGVSAR